MSRVLGWLLFLLAACDPGAFDGLASGEGELDSGVTKGDGGPGVSAPAGGRDAGRDAGGDAAPSSPVTKDGGRDSGPAPEDAGDGDASDGMQPGDGGPPGCPRADDPAAVQITATDQGELTVASVDEPTAADSVQVGERLLWTFRRPPMAIWGRAGEPSSGPPALAAPEPYVPLLPAGAVTVGDVHLGSAIPWSDHEALIFFAGAYGFAIGEVGLARITEDQPQAEVIHVTGQMFPHHRLDDLPMPWTPVFHTGAVVHDEPEGHYLYVYACNPNPNEPSELPEGARAGPCRVARVPHGHVRDGTRYRYWNGEAWDEDVRRAVVVMDHMALTISVSYNEYLQKFLAVTSGADNDVRLLWSERPEGPWQTLGGFATMLATGGFGITYGALEHAGLRDECHRTLYVTYVLSRNVTDPQGMTSTVGSTRLVRVELD